MGGGSSLLRIKLSMKGRRSFLDLSLIGTVGPCNIWWRGWSGFSALVCRCTPRLFLLMLGGRIPERRGKRLSGVARRQPVMVRIDSFKGTSTLCACTLRHQAGAQYSAGAYTRARAEVLIALKDAPHFTFTRCLIRATFDVTLLFRWLMSDLKVKLRSRQTPRYFGLVSNLSRLLSSNLILSL